MVTNSHCTWGSHQTGGWVGTELYQNQVSGVFKSYYWYGIEVQDPAFSSNIYGCPSGYQCRYSDAALVSIDQVSTSVGWDFGGIARTTYRAVLPDIYGSLTRDSYNPTFQIRYVSSDIFVGDFAEKVGRTTGWTGGDVTSTCYTVQIYPHAFPCQVRVSAGVGRGDSGSPVFWQSSSGSYLLFGILHAGEIEFSDGTGRIFYFSKWKDVDHELGTINTDLYPEDPVGPEPVDCTTDPTAPC